MGPVLWCLLETCLAVTARGAYVRTGDSARRLRSQQRLHEQAVSALRDARQRKPTIFEPHRPQKDR